MSIDLEHKPWMVAKFKEMEMKADGQRSIERAMADQGGHMYRGQARNDMQLAGDANDSLLDDIARALGIEVTVTPATGRRSWDILREVERTADQLHQLADNHNELDATMCQMGGERLRQLAIELAGATK